MMKCIRNISGLQITNLFALMHTVSFAKNFLQIDSINSCSTLKELQRFDSKLFLFYFSTLKGEIGIYFENITKTSNFIMNFNDFC